MAAPGQAAAHSWPRRGVCATVGALAAARWAAPPQRPPAAEALGYPVPEERQGVRMERTARLLSISTPSASALPTE